MIVYFLIPLLAILYSSALGYNESVGYVEVKVNKLRYP